LYFVLCVFIIYSLSTYLSLFLSYYPNFHYYLSIFSLSFSCHLFVFSLYFCIFLSMCLFFVFLLSYHCILLCLCQFLFFMLQIFLLFFLACLSFVVFFVAPFYSLNLTLIFQFFLSYSSFVYALSDYL
jgi:hypothetical protein